MGLLGFYFSPSGRISRGWFWVGLLGLFAFEIVFNLWLATAMFGRDLLDPASGNLAKPARQLSLLINLIFLFPIFVVLATPVLLLCGSFVFDGGRGIVAKRQTQNAADAGALAKATDCAKAVSTTAFAAYQTDGAVLANAPTCGSGTTTVSMTKHITATFPLGIGPWDVTRDATARWGTIGGATTAPVVISQCTFDLATANGTTFPSAEVIIPLGAGGPACPGRPPGSFGWLDTGLSGLPWKSTTGAAALALAF